MKTTQPNLRSVFDSQVWPAVPSARGAMLLALLHQFEGSQWWSPQTLLEHQFSQLSSLLHYAATNVPFYQSLYAGHRLSETLTAANWAELPIVERRAVQAAGSGLRSVAVPQALGAVSDTETSGSTGEPVKLQNTELDRLMWEASTLREHHWHQRDFSARFASIRVFGNRVGAPPDGSVAPNWGVPVAEVYASGPASALAIGTDVHVQARWLQRQDPGYLLSYPTNIQALLDHATTHGWTLPHLREVRTIGETVPPTLRQQCEEVWGVPLVDVYSSRELGYIALQCPDSGLYHINSETVLVEVLDENGNATRPGAIGRVVVSTLHNFVTPLLRYALNDHAEVGPPCPCGRGLPTLTRILGRTRNMVVLPDGRRYWPQVGFGRYRAIAPVIQFQLAQTTRNDIEVRLVVARQLVNEEETQLGAVIRNALGYDFALQFKYYPDAIPRGAGGKFEEFVCLVDD